MKVLFLAPYITILQDQAFTKNITGFGHMVRDIADYISRTGVKVDIVTTSAITKGIKCNKMSILKRTWSDILLHIKPYYCIGAKRLIKTYRPSRRRMVKIMYYSLSAGYVEYILKQGKYDMVHIHGVGFGTSAFIDCCERLGIKYMVTLHGLNSFSDSVQMEVGEKQYEKDFLQKAYKRIVPITVISSGILGVIKNYLNVQNEIAHFHIVTNGTDVTPKTNGTLDIRRKHGIKNNCKVMLCIGNLTKNKNQLQIVRAFALLPEEVKSSLCILFLGKDGTNGEVRNKITELGLGNHLILCGNISRNEIGLYYKQSNYTVIASVSEGFGLSIIEGFVYGLPNLTFADLDAVNDLYDEKTMHILTERSDRALANGISQMLTKNWDHEYIKLYAKKFSLEQMAQQYVNIYRRVLEY